MDFWCCSMPRKLVLAAFTCIRVLGCIKYLFVIYLVIEQHVPRRGMKLEFFGSTARYTSSVILGGGAAGPFYDFFW